jgi:hypothetical protein
MTEGTRGGDGKFVRTIKNAQRDADAAALRAKGWSFQRIANELGFASKGKAHDAVSRAFADIPTEDTEEAKRLDLERIDRLLEFTWDVLEREHVTISDGHVVRRKIGTEHDENGYERLDDEGKPTPLYEDVMDDDPVLRSVDRIAKLLERRAKIIGYDAPARSEVITMDAIEAAIRKLEAEVGNNSGRNEAGAPSLPS